MMFRIFSRPESAFRFRSIKKLELSYTNVDIAIFASEEMATAFGDTLTHLYLDGCFNVDNYSLFHLRHLKALKNLDISHCSSIDDVGIQVLAYSLPQIQSLNLSYLFRLTDKGITRLFRLPNLETVNLLGCYRIRNYPWACNLLEKNKASVYVSPKCQISHQGTFAR